MNKLVSIFSKVGFWTRKKSPELLVIGSIVAAAGSIILAIKATPKAEVVVSKANKDLKQLKVRLADDNALANGIDTVKDIKKDVTKVYAKTAFELGKLYLPTAIGFTLTVAGILGSHKIMKGRNVALAAAYTTLENGYRSYRERVAAKVGEKVENDIFRNMYEENKEVVIDKDGTEVVQEVLLQGPHVKPDTDFSIVWGRTARDWVLDDAMNLNMLFLKQKALNARLKSVGALFLHEVYEDLGIDVTVLGEQKLQASRVLGWIYDPSDPTRDSYIDFGLFDEYGNRNEYAMQAIRERHQEYFLEFNVDGDILTGKNGKRTFMKSRTVA